MHFSSLFSTLFLFDVIHAGQQPLALDIIFQGNVSEISEKPQVNNSTIKVVAADLDSFAEDGHSENQLPKGRPWTHKPECIHNDDRSEEYCVYTDKTFARGRGISFFTSPTIAARVAKLPAFTNHSAHDHVNNFEDPPWEVRNILGRGNGLFATRTLNRGDLILASTPVGVFQSDAFFLDYPLGYRYLHTAFDRLSDTTMKSVMRTATHSPGDPYMERLNTNAFAGELEEAPHFMFYPETAVSPTLFNAIGNVPGTDLSPQLLNHDCRPKYVHFHHHLLHRAQILIYSTLYYHDTSTLIHATYAARTILSGEEITITCKCNTSSYHVFKANEIQI